MKVLNFLGIVFLLILLESFESDKIFHKKLTNPEKIIKIGLLIQDNKSVEARYAAEMAIQKINLAGGIEGKPLQLVTRSMEGPWGTGSKQAVDLIFNENVWAILGSHDGRNAHLVEQATAKTHIVFLSAWASDPTLSQAFVPWFFNCVPNDKQQANALIEEIYTKRKFTKTAVVFDNSYDSKLASETFVKTCKKMLKPEPLSINYENSINNFKGIADQIEKSKLHAIVLFGKASSSTKIIEEIKKRKLNLTIFGALSIIGENEISDFDLKKYENVVIISVGNNAKKNSTAFQKEYQKAHGKLPGAVAAYAYDGMNVIIESLKKSGLKREILKNSMLKIQLTGTTGTIQFDDKGNRKGQVELMEIKNGLPVSIHK